MSDGVYLDYAASTPMRSEALQAMEPFLAMEFGNPSGGHRAALAAKNALEEARESVADLLGARPNDIVFTAGGTEADNLAVKGAARAARAATSANGVVTARFEHKGVLASVDRLESEGFRVTRIGVGHDGIVALDQLADALDATTAVVSVMLVNNEVGTIQPLDQIVELVGARAPRAVVHTDAVQAVPWIDVASAAADADLVAISAHKFGGPKGVGALVVRGNTPLEPLVEGGGQERGLRSGTSNVAGAVAMAAALRATIDARAADSVRIGTLRDRLVDGLLSTVPESFENGDRTRKVAGNAHVGFRGVEAESLLVLLDIEGLFAAAGSSCSSGATEPSHVLDAMGMPRSDALASIRLSLGFASTDADVDAALHLVPRAVAQLRAAGVAA
ncbi:MAG: cysteine desulfurase family protein [Acidimicrobiia bacterium]